MYIDRNKERFDENFLSEKRELLLTEEGKWKQNNVYLKNDN